MQEININFLLNSDLVDYFLMDPFCVLKYNEIKLAYKQKFPSHVIPLNNTKRPNLCLERKIYIGRKKDR